jgi:hypothetical protein
LGWDQVFIAAFSEPARLDAYIIETLGKLQQRDCAPGQRLVVLAVVDEAQLLDTLISPVPSTRQGGARAALQYLRKMQQQVWRATQGMVLLLPIATGINPAVSLANGTLGSHRHVDSGDAKHVTLATMTAISRAALRDRALSGARRVASTNRQIDQQCHRLALVFHPCVRDLLTFAKTLRSCTANINWTADVGPKLTAVNAMLLIRAAFDPSPTYAPISADEMPDSIPFDGELQARPALHFRLWGHLHYALANEFRPIARPPMTSVSIDGIDGRVTRDSATFEQRVFDTWLYWMSLFCAPQPLARHELPPNLHPAIKGWLPEDAFILANAAGDVLPEHKENYFPFMGVGTHSDAIARGLHFTVQKAIEKLAIHEAAWFLCAGSAAIDFILVVRRPKSVLQVRLMDAKHTSLLRGKSGSTLKTTTMRAKAELVYDGIRQGLRKTPFTVDGAYDDRYLLMATNADMANDWSPRTFAWHPWSALLFDGASM